MPLIAASVSLGSPFVVALLAVLALVELGLLAWALLDLALSLIHISEPTRPY